MSDTTDTGLLFEKTGRTAVITLNRPHKKNALDPAVREALTDALVTVRDDASIRSVVLAGAGGDFCSGTDLKAAPDDIEPVFSGRAMVLDFDRWFSELLDLEKPVVAAVDGVAAGAGLALALGADFVLASPGARFLSPFLRIGLVPDLSLMYLLPRLVGMAKAKEIVFSAREIDAEEALSMGLVQTVIPAERLLQAALEYASQFDDAPPQALGMAKIIMNRAFESDRQAMKQMEAAAQGLCGASTYHAEALRRFRTREKPLFSGAKRVA